MASKKYLVSGWKGRSSVFLSVTSRQLFYPIPSIDYHPQKNVLQFQILKKFSRVHCKMENMG